jgi:hypothetical protein
MPDLAITTLETSPSLDICQGFAIIPSLGTLRASVQGSNVQRVLIDVNFESFFINVIVNVRWSYFFGICGPAWAMNTEVGGNFDNPDQPAVQLNWAGKYGDGTQDGFAGGIQVGLEFALTWNYDIFPPRIFPRLQGNGEFRINILKTFLDFLITRAGSSNSSAKGSDKPRTSNAGTLDFDMFQTRNGEWKSKGNIQLTPGIEGTLNVIDLIPFTKAANALLQRFGGNVIAGPVVQVGFPITIAPSEIVIGKQSYNNLRFDASRTIGDRNAAGDKADNADTKLTLNIKQTSRVEVRVGIELALSHSRFGYFGQKWTWSIIDFISALAGVNLGTDTDAFNALENTIGTVNKSFDAQGSCGCGPAAPQTRRKVVFGGASK